MPTGLSGRSENGKSSPIGESTLNEKIRLATSGAPSGIQFSERIKRPGLWGHVLGVDLAYLPFGWKDEKKKERNFHIYVQCNDLTSKDRIDYGLIQEKTTAGVRVFLAEIRDRLDYKPKLITIDLEDILAHHTVQPMGVVSALQS